MALCAVDNKRAGLRAAAADLDAVADLLDIARLAEHAVIEFLATLRRPFQQLDGAVDRDVFFVAGDQERDRALRLAAIGLEIIEHRGDAAGDAALHVDGAAAVEIAVLDVAGERAVGPGALVARRHHVGMAGESDVRRAGADAGIEVVDIGGAGFAEGDAMHLEAGGLQSVSSTPSAPASAGVTEGSEADRGQWRGRRSCLRLTWRPAVGQRCAGRNSELALLVPARAVCTRPADRGRTGWARRALQDDSSTKPRC